MSALPTGTLTLFFTDVEGSTRLQHELRERYDEALGEHHRIIRAALEAHGGHEVDTQGEAFFATFARATDAAAAAADVQRGFAGHVFSVRVGLHTGQPRVAETGYVGLDVPRAARICAAASGGQVLLSQTTRELIGEEFQTRDLGEHRLKDLIQPIRLHQLIAKGLSDTFPPPSTLEARPTNLPLQATLLVGRTREVAAVSDLLLRDDVRLVTLTGAGGTGKTRIALQVAAETVDRFDDGTYFVPLEAVTDPTLVVPAIAQALGIAGAADLNEAVREFLGSRELLLVLDNFEQLADSAPLLNDLLRGAPRVLVLVTSREPLRLSAEHEFPVPPLGVPQLDRLPELAALSQYESVALFIERAQAARPDFGATEENAPAIAEICVRLDGLPLAIELAAARVRLLTPQAMLARLGSRLGLLTGGARDLPSRQRTLRGTIDWSYELLDEPARQLLARLSVFAGGCSVDAAEAVCDATLDGLESLIEKNLLRQEEGPGGEPRFTMLETIREYAAERLEERPDADETRRRHLHFYVDWYAKRRARRFGVSPLTGDYERDEQEHENGQAALAFAERSGAVDAELRLCGGVGMLWRARGLYEHGRRRLEAALARATDAAPDSRAWALNDLANLCWPMGRWDEAYRYAAQAFDVFDRLDDDRGRAFAAGVRGIAADGLGKGEEALRWYDESERFHRRLGSVGALAVVLNNRGYSFLMQGDLERAEPLLREANELLPDEGSNVMNLGLVALRLGRIEEAAGFYARALRIGLDDQNPEYQFYGLEGLGCVAAARGDDRLAGRLWGASETMRESINAPLQGGERETHDVMVAESRERIGADALQAAWAEGRAMAADDAVALALA